MKFGTYTAAVKWLPELTGKVVVSRKIKVDRKYQPLPKGGVPISVSDKAAAVSSAK